MIKSLFLLIKKQSAEPKGGTGINQWSDKYKMYSSKNTSTQ